MSATARHEAAMKRDMQTKLRQATDPLEKLRLQCLARGAAGIKGLGRTFKIFDDDGNNQLSFEEFSKGLHDYGVYLDSDVVRRVFDRFDANKDGSLSFDEFLKALRVSDADRPPFQKLDKDGNGRITKEDLKGVYDVKKNPKYISGEMDEDELLEEFLASFDTPGRADGKVEWDEFVSYYSGVSASIDTDTYFVLMMTQAWKL
ncbi:uncharacterized protein MONBRDRAFT_13937 [Monosiga brevicollis MX1]|uniref:EF-hand domain-containing protein n=1 Tax=Monosiga brevicollis TaxID=81824 RepID=A9UQK6_MONBE|nr:uncharacterized protein MONBRDRAFT_13937 [Monosiga brevicollis MX1]EDQ93062.1 predicted protein [Monosiga brevicollis MX1]|eukprot:XP_001742824.1 hypothetical protein [Monosiga brevicollis MX1]